ncbi:MAG: ModD protein [Bacteroidales bacterium]|nr:ModD protein [Bacteroidales bacterium]
MIYFTDSEIDQLITEDLPYFDLTSLSVKLGSKVARISFTTRHSTVLCGTEEVIRIFEKFHIQPTLLSVSGEYIDEGIKFLEGEGLAKNIHSIWRVTANLMEFSSGIATRMRELVTLAQAVNKDISVVTTRKSQPFTKKLSLKAIQTGGGNAHRLGLSDTVLIFNNHIKFIGGLDMMISKLPQIAKRAAGRSITVEVQNSEDALKIAGAQLDGIQLDKIPAGELKKLVPKIRKINPSLRIAATGSISASNIQEFADTGVDIIVTSFPYYGRPADFQVNIEPVFDL